MNKKYLTLIGLLLLVITAFFTASHFWRMFTYTEEIPIAEKIPTAFTNIRLEAEAAYVYDIATGEVLYAHNAHQQYPLASITKVMTALIAWDEKPDRVIITKDALIPEGDSGFLTGEQWQLRDLIDFMLVTSSNDGARALALAVDAGTTDIYTKMNRMAERLNMHQTFFVNESGLDVAEGVTGGSYGSAHDIALLFAHILKTYPSLFAATTQSAISVQTAAAVHEGENTNEFVDHIPSLVASKTGFTDLAGGNLAVVFEAGPNRPIAAVVLRSGKEERFSDIETLVWESLKYLNQ